MPSPILMKTYTNNTLTQLAKDCNPVGRTVRTRVESNGIRFDPGQNWANGIDRTVFLIDDPILTNSVSLIEPQFLIHISMRA